MTVGSDSCQAVGDRKMKRSVSFLILLMGTIGVTAFVLNRSADRDPSQTVSASAPETGEIIAPGRVEPVSEEVKVSSQIPGKLSSVPLEEGARVHRGQIIAAIAN